MNELAPWLHKPRHALTAEDTATILGQMLRQMGLVR
jgi:hypothetical protein